MFLEVEMRLMLIISMFGVMLFLSSIVSADSKYDCQTICIDKKALDDNKCPSPDLGMDQSRVQCLQNDQDTYNNCLKECTSKTAPAKPSFIPPPPLSDKPQFTPPTTISTPPPILRTP
jgi:hypothetical protein